MSPPIIELLRAGGVPLPRDGSAWRHLLVVHNVGSVPVDDPDGDIVRHRGFNLVVVDEAATPTHFVKFRPKLSASNRPSLASRLSRVPELSSIMPTTWSIFSDDIQGEVSRYVSGELLELRARVMDRDMLRDALTDVLAAARRVATAAASVDPSLVAGSEQIDLSAAGAWALDMLVSAGISRETLEPFAAALRRAGTVPRSLQHGDLWPRNVLDANGHWCLLDFELYGRIQVPLYDALHLVRTSWDARRAWRSSGPAWIDELVSHSAEAQTYQELLLAAGSAAGLSAIQMGGALVYYVADMGARLFWRPVPPEDVAPYLHEVRRLSDWLLSGRPAEDLLLPAR